MKNVNKIWLIILIALLAIFGLYVVFKNESTKKTKTNSSISQNTFEDVMADLNGDGNQETLRLSFTDTGKVTSLIALDKNGIELGRLPSSMPLPLPFSNSGKAYTPLSKYKRQFVSFNFIAGPHSSQTMFFGLQDKTKEVLPVCLTAEVKGPEDCLFWSGEVGELIIKDLDNDGNLEIVETVDEYPKDGAITQEEEKAINDTFKDQGKIVTDGAKRIAMREKGGRGNKVIWGIYRFNGNFFENQTESNYEKYFTLANQFLKTTYTNYPTIMKRSAISKESEDYNVFMRKFWTGV